MTRLKPPLGRRLERGGRVKRLTYNSAWLLLSRVAAQALFMLLTVFVARHLGEGGLGQYAFINAMMLIGNVLTTYGLDTLLIREVARRASADTPLVGAALFLQLGFSTAFILLVAALGGRLPNQTAATLPALRLASLSLLPLAMASVYSAILRAYERMDLYLLFGLIGSGAQAVIGIVMLRQGQGLVGLAWAMLLGHLLGAATAAGLCWGWLPDFRHSWRMSWPVLKRTAAAGWRLALLMLLAVLYQKLGVFSLSLLGDDAATGWFSAAGRILEAAKLMPYALIGALFPAMARRPASRAAVRHEPAATRSVGELGMLLFYAIGGGLALAGLAGRLIPWLYGEGYEPSVRALQLLALSLAPFVVSLRCSFDLISQGKEGLALRATFLTSLLALPLFAWLVPAWGVYGGCLAVVLGELIQATILLLSMGREQPPVSPQAFSGIDLPGEAS